MTFYFKPPRGDIPFHRLQECLEERIRYLNFVKETVDISDCCESFKFEYLIDGSALDRTGHFMLRLMALRLNVLKGFFMESESLLFEKRLASMKHSQVERELRTTLRHVKEILLSSSPLVKYYQFLHNFAKLCEEMISSKSTMLAFDKDHSHNCSKHKIQVPFTFCLPLVSARHVELNKGNAIIPCSKWRQLLSCLFSEHIRQGMDQLAASNAFQNVWEDDRVKYLYDMVKAQFKCHHQGVTSNFPSLSAKDVDRLSSLFPPCMKNLHTFLRQRHRLSHYSRFYYSLFLKDIGMPLMESVEFWSNEYSQAHSNCTSCSHSWQKDNKRYMYSIRHMYGLEGARREYRGPSCHQLQKMCLSTSSEGGCPFVNFDQEKLVKCLHDKFQSDKNSIDLLVQVKLKESPSEACKMYCGKVQDLLTKQNNYKSNEDLTSDRECKVLSPSQFYSNLSSLNRM